MQIEQRNYLLIDLIQIPFQCNFWASSLLVIHRILLGVVPLLQVLVTAKFIDNVILVLQAEITISQVYPSIFFLVLLLAYQQLANALMNFSSSKLKMGIQARFRTAVTEKRGRLAYYHIENPVTWDLISRVSEGVQTQISPGFQNLLDLISMVIRILGLLALLFSQVWWVAPVILTFSIPLFALAMKGGQAAYEVNREVSKVKRKHEYFGEVLLGREFIEERTLFGFGQKINQEWYELFEKARLLQYQTEKKWMIRMKSGSLLTTMISILIVIVLLNPVLTGLITIGMFISLVNAVFSLIEIMSWQFTSRMDQFARSREYLKDLTKFALLEEIEGAGDLPVDVEQQFDSLEFKEVSFAYPGTEKLILDELSFCLESGKHYAFVGVNGAGKTTITKLITGLYDNYTGQILFNGRDLKIFSQAELKSFINVFYQDFARYFITLGENISLGNPNQDYDECSVQETASQLGLDKVIDNLSAGMNTPLGKLKKTSQDLSGGEWQLLAMARAVYNPAPLRILDEPTAALDPLTESNLYRQFEEISRGKTTIFISHRLGSTKLADHIFVIDGGRLAESGTHEELVNIRGIYFEMYESQRGWYS